SSQSQRHEARMIGLVGDSGPSLTLTDLGSLGPADLGRLRPAVSRVGDPHVETDQHHLHGWKPRVSS
ncbi:MAG: hypothetical protein VYC98_00600, partial [Planctomycetota bacterium]|nr:hypothetical protein [Planctomycetota bacterium]